MSEIKAKILSSNNGAVGFDGNGVLWQTKNLATADLTVGGAGWQALDANGSAGNYEVIIEEGNYTSGTFAYPNGHIDSDYDKIEIISGFTGDVNGQSRGFNAITREGIAAYPSTWKVTCSCSTSDTNIVINVWAGTSLNFNVGNAAGGRVMQIIGYLKEGVI